MLRSFIKGVGKALPKLCLSNDDLAQFVETSDEWIRERTGITQRFRMTGDESTSTLAASAALHALERSGISPQEVDGIIVATSTPDHPFPATAAKVQALINAPKAFSFDVQAACAGFIPALSIADTFLRTGQAQTIVVIGAESMTRLLDWNDRTTCVLFGDGAGAIVLKSDQSESRGILNTCLFSDGKFYQDLYVNTTNAQHQHPGEIMMNGKEIFRQGVSKMAQAIQAVCEKEGVSLNDLDWVIPHQANSRIIQGIAQTLQLPQEKLIQTVHLHANTSTASIPLAMEWAVGQNLLKEGQLIALVGLGAGLNWGAILLRF